MRLSSLLLLLVLAAAPPSAPRPAQSDRSAPLFTTTSGTFFALSVPDLDASVAWYSAKLGLKTARTMSGPDGGRVAILEGSGLIVELVQLPKAQPLSQAAPSVRDRPYLHGIFKAGLIVDDFDAVVAGLKARDVEIAFGPFPARDGQRANLIVRDNAGNLIQFFGK